jgi:hypothetical protein
VRPRAPFRSCVYHHYRNFSDAGNRASAINDRGFIETAGTLMLLAESRKAGYLTPHSLRARDFTFRVKVAEVGRLQAVDCLDSAGNFRLRVSACSESTAFA